MATVKQATATEWHKDYLSQCQSDLGGHPETSLQKHQILLIYRTRHISLIMGLYVHDGNLRCVLMCRSRDAISFTWEDVHVVGLAAGNGAVANLAVRVGAAAGKDGAPTCEWT